jgi:hypothetical protein
LNGLARRWLVAAALALGIGLASVAPAQASLLGSVTNVVNGCSGQTSQAFRQWGDLSWYALASGGDFENGGQGWSLSGGAATGGGSDPFAITGTLGSRSLAIGDGGEAVSPAICFDLMHQTYRFMVRNDSTSDSARLKVEILYSKAGSAVPAVLRTDVVSVPQGAWQPSQVYVSLSDLSLLSGLSNPSIQLRFYADGGSWRVDDVEIDPFRM